MVNGTTKATFPSYHDKDFINNFPAVEYGIRQDIDGDRQEDLAFQVRAGLYYVSSQHDELHTIRAPL